MVQYLHFRILKFPLTIIVIIMIIIVNFHIINGTVPLFPLTRCWRKSVSSDIFRAAGPPTVLARGGWAVHRSQMLKPERLGGHTELTIIIHHVTICMYVCTHTHIYIYVYVYVCVYIYMYIYVYIHTYIYMYICIYIYMYMYARCHQQLGYVLVYQVLN